MSEWTHSQNSGARSARVSGHESSAAADSTRAPPPAANPFSQRGRIVAHDRKGSRTHVRSAAMNPFVRHPQDSVQSASERNDQLLAEKLLQARAASARTSGNGAVIHEFALWKKKNNSNNSNSQAAPPLGRPQANGTPTPPIANRNPSLPSTRKHASDVRRKQLRKAPTASAGHAGQGNRNGGDVNVDSAGDQASRAATPTVNAHTNAAFVSQLRQMVGNAGVDDGRSLAGSTTTTAADIVEEEELVGGYSPQSQTSHMRDDRSVVSAEYEEDFHAESEEEVIEEDCGSVITSMSASTVSSTASSTFGSTAGGAGLVGGMKGHSRRPAAVSVRVPPPTLREAENEDDDDESDVGGRLRAGSSGGGGGGAGSGHSMVRAAEDRGRGSSVEEVVKKSVSEDRDGFRELDELRGVSLPAESEQDLSLARRQCYERGRGQQGSAEQPAKSYKTRKSGQERHKRRQSRNPIDWSRGEQIGSGTFGSVYKALNRRTGQTFAAKQIALTDGGSDEEVENVRSEIRLMKRLEHAHIVRYIGTERAEGMLYIFMEYVPNGSIFGMLKEYGAFHEDLIQRFTYQILLGVEYLHREGIVHRDIKGANVLVSDHGVAKLADFGCSKQLLGMKTASLEESLQLIHGSVPWMAPEVVKQSGHGRSADIWSVGATVIEMATAKHPWPDFNNNLAALFHVATSTEPPPYPSDLSPEAKSFLGLCLAIDPAERALARILLRHPFLERAQQEYDRRPASEPETRAGGSAGGVGRSSGHHHHHRGKRSSRSAPSTQAPHGSSSAGIRTSASTDRLSEDIRDTGATEIPPMSTPPQAQRKRACSSPPSVSESSRDSYKSAPDPLMPPTIFDATREANRKGGAEPLFPRAAPFTHATPPRAKR